MVVHWKIVNLFQLCAGFLKSGDKTLWGWVKTYLLSYLGESSSTNQLFGIWMGSKCRHRAPALSRPFAVAGSRPWRPEAEAHKTGAAALGNQKSGCQGSQPCCCTGRIPWTSGILEAKARGFGGAVPPKKEVVTGKCVHLHRPRLWLECMMNSRDLMVIFMEIWWGDRDFMGIYRWSNGIWMGI